MNNSGLGGGFLSNPNGGLLDLESSNPIHQQSRLSHSSLTHQQQMNMLGPFENDHRQIGQMEMKTSNPRGFSMNSGKGKTVCHNNTINNANMSEEDDEPSFTEDGDGDNPNGGKNKKGSCTWQRMKWTDNIVRLLIAVVACVGDDGVIESMEGHKRKLGLLQKKGKWKTVSKIMISKGCQVSPQQCEDKFNDLNKRYKRLNDILGRGVSCQVVENPTLMDSLPNLSDKAKDDVKKILSSKHLFYKEMCAYHNGQRIPNCHDVDLQGLLLPSGKCSKDDNGSEEEEGEKNDDTEDDESDDDEDCNDGDGERNRRSYSRLHDFEVEMQRIFHDSSKSLWDRRQWVKRMMLQLQEQRVNFQLESFELEKQRVKWLRYCSQKDRELERLRMENETMRLENQRTILLLRQKELELDFKGAESSLNATTSFDNRMPGRDQIDLGRFQ